MTTRRSWKIPGRDCRSRGSTPARAERADRHWGRCPHCDGSGTIGIDPDGPYSPTSAAYLAKKTAHLKSEERK